MLFLMLVASPVFACNIFQANVVSYGYGTQKNVVSYDVGVQNVCAHAVNSYAAQVPVPAQVQTRVYSQAVPFAAPVVLQQSVPVVQNYSIQSVQPVIGVNSLVPTAVNYGVNYGVRTFSAAKAFNSFNVLNANHHRGGSAVVFNANNRNHGNVVVLNNNHNRGNVAVLNAGGRNGAIFVNGNRGIVGSTVNALRIRSAIRNNKSVVVSTR